MVSQVEDTKAKDPKAQDTQAKDTHEEDPPTLNLEHYFSKLTLQPIVHGPYAPPMPPPNERSVLTPLTLMPGGYRQLQVIDSIKELARKAAAYFSKLDDGDREIARELKLKLQAEVAWRERKIAPCVVNNAINVTNVLSRFLLRSTETLLGTVDGNMREWMFRPVFRPRQNAWETQALDPIILSRLDASGKYDSVKVVLLSLCPWEFTPRDFDEFAALERFDDTPEGDWSPRPWVNADRLRAYLYDLCLDFDCPYFVVTSHVQWCFGSFSKQYTTAYISSPISFDHRPTSIIEILMYWIHLSCGKPNDIPASSVDDEQDDEQDDMTPEQWQQERQLHAKRFLHDDLSGDRDLTDGDAPPAKRRRHGPGDDDTKVADQTFAAMMRRRYPRRRHANARATAAAKKRAKLVRNRSSESVISVDISVAPSCAERLPEPLIPRRRNEAIQRWRNLVAVIEEHGEVPQDAAAAERGKWVDFLLCDPTTGEPTGNIERMEDHTCSSCGPPSPTLSACSLTSAELARWNQPTDHDPFQDLLIHQWF